MPDFNKGDFTQQGVAGHVNANLRLNEKRLVNIDLTSNEEAEGCTINGTVTDLLNDKVYAIGSGVSGNIEITENAENINVAPYATATVNVSGGGGDSDTATVTFKNVGEPGSAFSISSVIVIKDGELYTDYDGFTVEDTVDMVIPVCGSTYIFKIGDSLSGVDPRVLPTVSGDAVLDMATSIISITGDCTITAAGGGEG